MKNNFIKKIDKAIISQNIERDFTSIDSELESLGYNIEEINSFSEKLYKQQSFLLKRTKEQVFRDGFSLFINEQIPNDIFDKYMNDEDGDGTSELQYWILNNMRTEIMDWCTGIGIIEAVEHLYKTAVENGNL